MAKVRVIVSVVKEVEVPDRIYKLAHLPEEEACEHRYFQYQEAINTIGSMVGYDADPEEGCEWVAVGDIENTEVFEGLIAMVDEDGEILAQA